MTIDQNQASVEICRSCGQLLDLSAMSPLSVVACPVCNTSTTVLRRLGPFQLERLIGQGGMGAVYQANDLGLKRLVAIKVLHRSWSHDQTLTAQFEHEAAMTARINHPNVVRVYSTGTSHGMFYIAMELVNQGSLDSWMDKSSCLPEGELLEVAIQVAEGLQAAYRAGLIHRDIKPGNILFAEKRLTKIVDFGLALHSSENANGEIWGTPGYIAPEALAAKHEDFRSDMYALGATLWHALAGKPPHSTNSTSVTELLEIKRQPVDLAKAAPWLHPKTVATLNRTLAFRPEDRYPDYESFIKDLKKALVEMRPEVGSTRTRLSRSSWKPALATALLLVGLSGTALWKFKTPPVEKPFIPGEASVSDETRLHNANQLLAAGQLEQATQLFELILRTPDLSPRVTAWCRVSLATAYSLQGKTLARTPLFQSLSMTGIADDPALTAFLRGLPGVAPGTKWRTDPDAARQALQQLWIGLFHLGNKNWKAARGPIETASAFDPTGWGETEVVSLLPLAKLTLKDLEGLKVLEQHFAQAAKRSDFHEAVLEGETIAQSILLPTLRAGAIDSIAKSKATHKKAHDTSAPAPVAAIPKSKPPAPAATADPAANQRFDTLKKETSEMISLFRYQAAAKRITEFATEFPSESHRTSLLLEQVRACSLLFDWALREIQRASLPLPYPTLRDGVLFPARPTRADTETVHLETENGSSRTFPWKEISPVYLLTLATQRLPSITAPMPRAELLWLAGNFQIALGSTEKGHATLRQAVELNPNYANAFKALVDL